MAYDPSELVDPTKPFSSDNPLARAISDRPLGVPASQANNKTGLLAYAEDTSNVVTPMVNGSYVDSSLVISVPPTPELWLELSVSYQITVAGAGAAFAVVFDITAGGAGVQVGSFGAPILATNSGTWTVFKGIPVSAFRIGPTTNTRTYILKHFLARDTSSSLAVSARNNTSAPSWLAAIGR